MFQTDINLWLQTFSWPPVGWLFTGPTLLGYTPVYVGLLLAAFFRSRRALAFVVVWVPLMALSRLYLGRHFLADLLGGLAFGLAATGLAVVLFRPLDEEASATPGRTLVPIALFGAVLLALTPFVPARGSLRSPRASFGGPADRSGVRGRAGR